MDCDRIAACLEGASRRLTEFDIRVIDPKALGLEDLRSVQIDLDIFIVVYPQRQIRGQFSDAERVHQPDIRSSPFSPMTPPGVPGGPKLPRLSLQPVGRKPVSFQSDSGSVVR